MLPQSKQRGQLGKNFGYAILGLIVVSGLSDTVTLSTRFNYELRAFSGTGYMRCFISCISLIMMLSKIKKNTYFSGLTRNEENEKV